MPANKRLPYRFLLLFCLSAWPLLAQAQGNRITGRVVDAETKDPIAFASISLRDEGTGALTNEYGYFQLAMPVRSLHDSIVVLALGFRRTALLVRRGRMEDLILELPRQRVQLENITVAASKVRPLTLGSRASEPAEGMIQGLPGSQYACFMRNEKKRKLGYVRTVSFYIGENGFPREPFRVRLYKADGNYNAPNTDLLTENVVVSASRGGAWYTIDLTQYNIPAPEEGFLVAMEWIVSGDKFYTTNFMDNYTPYGQILRPTFEFKESRTWSYSIGKGWSLLTLANGEGRRYNAMIKAEVDAYK